MKIVSMADESSDSSDSESTHSEPEVPEEPPKTWLGYSWYLVRKMARGTWSTIHVVGDKLAWGLGITSPDWQYALDIHEDLLREAQEEQQEEEKALKRQEELVAQRLRTMENASTDHEQDRTTT
ncbi:protein FAM177A1-like [Halichondria panicea]|uniref:protein FAM177A1-like n=1 Tax=Halichondria panicea TaxID=6063 RepID=UPI00312B3552